MIPVSPQPEPTDFTEKVRAPGIIFLKTNPHPKVWKEYWRESLEDLHKLYGGICAYSAQWIPRTEGGRSVDHFIPKSLQPDLAYEWNNFRLACLKLNARKGDSTDIIDPFYLPVNSFILNFPSLLIKANPLFLDPLKARVDDTIKRLKLNEDDNCVQGRLEWLIPYCQNDISFPLLKSKAPFIAHELERQDLVARDKIAYIMKVKG